MYRGDNKTLALAIRDALGNPVDLTDALIWFTVKRAIDSGGGDSAAVLTRATANVEGGGDDQILITDEINGKAEIYIVPSNTQNMGIRTYVADVQAKPGTDGIYTGWVGTFILDGDVTRRNA